MGRPAPRALPSHAAGRLVVAADRRTPPALLEQLAEVGDDAVRAAVARNPSAHPETLRRLGSKRMPHQWGGPTLHPLWRALAGNPRTPGEVLRRLVHAPEVQARVVLAGNPAVPESILRELADDGAPEVRRAACVHAARRAGAPGGVPAHLSRALTVKARARALQRAGYAPAGTLRRLLASAHPATPHQQAEQLARSADWRDRLAAALNPRTTASTVTRLAEDGVRPVRAAARARLAHPARLLGLLPGGGVENG